MVRVADTREPWRSPLLQDAEAGVHADAGQHSNRGISYSFKTDPGQTPRQTPSRKKGCLAVLRLLVQRRSTTGVKHV